ncbi:MAG: sugar phosphorylase [Desulfobacteraceae bacterium]|jgi:sucrose phosphorylase
MGHIEEILAILNRLYDPDDAAAACKRIESLLSYHGGKEPKESASRFSQNDVVLITYADSLNEPGRVPLRVMGDFARRFLKEGFSAIHFLPFFPYSSDDGFSVIDYLALNPSVGQWGDVVPFSADFDLMFDYVLNHISAKSQWFESYLAQEPPFTELAHAIDPNTDLSKVTRPRALPLLTPFARSDDETVHLWTTFSEDQIDLNYKSIDILIKMIEVLLFYVEKGARLLRLDAVAYLWKEIGTSCIHLDQTHDMVRLLRKILDAVAPESIIITETNVPHDENISYFGDGFNEAQMVYNFTLPPLLLHTFLSEDAGEFSRWADNLGTPSDETTFFNFTASHDGIGVRPVEGILSAKQVERLIQTVQKNGGQVSYKQNPDGSRSPYELNITYVDALRRDDGMDAERFLASQSIQAALPGVPGIYIHSLLGSRNWLEGVAQTGRARTINRQKLQVQPVVDELQNQESFRSRVFHPYIHLLRVRRAQEAFHPNAAFEILRLDRRVVAIQRQTQHQRIFALVNISCETATVSLVSQSGTDRLNELLTGRQVPTDRIDLAPYQTVWLSNVHP